MTGEHGASPDAAVQRLDKWLWFARVTKSRTTAAELVVSGRVRVNRTKIDKPSTTVRVGDVVTVVANRRVRILQVTEAGSRRGPPAEARQLFVELSDRPAEPVVGTDADNDN